MPINIFQQIHKLDKYKLLRKTKRKGLQNRKQNTSQNR